MSEETPETTKTVVYPWKFLTPETDEWVQRTILIYGPSGTGKTNLACQVPKPLILSFDPGAQGGASTAVKHITETSQIKQLKVNSYKEALELIPMLQAAAGIEFSSLVLDSVTYLSRLTMDNILQSARKEIPAWDEYKLNYARMCHLINLYSEMKCHVIMTAIDQKVKDDKTGKITGGPAVPGKLTDELPQAVDICARLYVTTSYGADQKLKAEYFYRTVPDSTYFAKDRLELMPKEGVITGSNALTNFIKPLFKPNEF